MVWGFQTWSLIITYCIQSVKFLLHPAPKSIILWRTIFEKILSWSFEAAFAAIIETKYAHIQCSLNITRVMLYTVVNDCPYMYALVAMLSQWHLSGAITNLNSIIHKAVYWNMGQFKYFSFKFWYLQTLMSLLLNIDNFLLFMRCLKIK